MSREGVGVMYNNLFSLEDKVSIVTGGSSGIGRAIAEVFVEAGAEVVIVSRKEKVLEDVAQEIGEKFGGRVLPMSANIGNMEDIKNFMKKFKERFKRLDVLVNTVGINPYFGPIENLKERTWDKMLDVNLKGTFYLSVAAAEIMEETGGGSIINISSLRAYRAVVGGGMYALCKSAMCRLTEILAKEWANRNIRVNAIAPGLISTNFSRIMWEDEEKLKMNLSQTPMGRVAKPQEVAGAALYFASGASSYTTGTTLLVDGGAYLG